MSLSNFAKNNKLIVNNCIWEMNVKISQEKVNEHAFPKSKNLK